MAAKRALLVGCNYPGTDAALNGCINDVMRMKAMLVDVFGFSEDDITVMIDTDASYESPTGGNIKRRLSEKVSASEPGDVLVFHFSGHGTQVPAKAGLEQDGKDECICPTDMNVIPDDDLRRILKDLKDGVKFTMVADCCHSGSMLDHAAVQISGNKDPNATDMPDLGALGALFGIKDINAGGDRGLEIHNRSLSPDMLFQMLGQSTGGKVDASNIHQTLGSLFGEDASPMLMQMASMALPVLMSQMSGAGQQGAGAETAGCASCLPMLMGLISGSSKPQGQASGPGAAYQVPSAGAHFAGQKPPASEQLADDKGILITGCQAHETSADACPSGDKSQAYGALSNAIQTVVKAHHEKSPGTPLVYRDLVMSVRTILLQTGFKQNPCLECSNTHADEPFICGLSEM